MDVLLQDYEGKDSFAFDFVRESDDGALGNLRVFRLGKTSACVKVLRVTREFLNRYCIGVSFVFLFRVLMLRRNEFGKF